MATRRVSWNLRVSTEDQQVDRTGRKLDELIKKGEKLDKSTYSPKVDLDDDEFNTELADIRTDLERLEADAAEVKIDADDTEARAKMDRIAVQMRKLSQMVADPDIDVDGVILARSQLSDLQHKMNRLDRTRANPSVRIDGVSEMQKDASLLLDTIVALGPAGVVAGTVAAGGLLSMGPALISLGTGVGVLAGGLSGISDAVKAMNKMRLSRLAGDDPSASDLLALQRAFAAIPEEGRDFVRFIVNEMIPALEDLRGLAQEHLFPGLTDALRDLDTLLPQAKNLVINYADAWGELAQEGADALTDPFWRQYFDFLGDKGAEDMQIIVRTIGNFVEGLAATQQAFHPLQSDVENGILGWSQSFSEWGQSLRSSEDFQEFLDYVDRNGPRVIKLVESIADALLQIGEAASPVGEKLLPILTGIADFIGTVADSPLGTPLVAIAVGLSAINRAARVSEVVKGSAFMQGITLLGTQAKTAAGRLTLMKTAARGAAGVAGLGLMIGATQVANDKLSTMMSVLGGAATGAAIGAGFGGVGAVVGGVIGALGGLAISLGESGDAAEEAKPQVESYIDTLDRLTGAATRASRASAGQQLVDTGLMDDINKLMLDPSMVIDAMLGRPGRLRERLAALQREIQSQITSMDIHDPSVLAQLRAEGPEAVNAYYTKLGDLRSRLKSIRDILDLVGVSQQQLNEDQREANFITKGIYGPQLTRRLNDYGRGLRNVAEDLGLNRNRTDLLTEALEDSTTSFFESTGKIRLNKQELKAVADQMGLTKQQTDRLIESYNKMADRTEENRDAGDHYKNTLDRIGRSLDLTKRDTSELTDKLLKQEDANVRLKGKADLTEKQLRDVAHQMGLTKQETQELIEKYKDVPSDVRTDAHFNDDKARADVEDFVRWTEQKWEKLKTVSPGFFGDQTTHIPGGQFAGGGPITGPGTKTSDSIIIRASRGEFMQRASAVDREGLPAMHALNEGRATIVPKFAKGGSVGDALALDADYPWARVLSNFSSLRAMVKAMGSGSQRVQGAIAWARKQVGDDYRLGAVGPDMWDCSGFMSGITNFLRGNPLHVRLGSTATFPWPGFARGVDPTGFTIGSTPHYPGSGLGHMAGTLGGVNVESRGGEGVVVGPRARGWNDPGFSQVFHMTGIPKGPMRGPGSDTGALSRAEQFIINHESGGSVFANNPNSSAFGLGQLLEANRIKYARRLGYNWGIERGDTGSTDRARQIDMMRAYIRDRYGTAENAKRYWQAHGSYDQGGPVPHGMTAHNFSGLTEEMLTNSERQAFIALGRLAHVALVQAGTWGGGGSGSGFSGEISGTMVITNWEQGTAYFRGVANDNYNGRSRHAARMARMG